MAALITKKSFLLKCKACRTSWTVVISIDGSEYIPASQAGIDAELGQMALVKGEMEHGTPKHHGPGAIEIVTDQNSGKPILVARARNGHYQGS